MLQAITDRWDAATLSPCYSTGEARGSLSFNALSALPSDSVRTQRCLLAPFTLFEKKLNIGPLEYHKI